MFDITTAQRKKVYASLKWVSGTLASLAAILTAVLALVGTGGAIAPILTSVIAVMGVGGTYAGKLAEDHTILGPVMDALDSTPGN